MALRRLFDRNRQRSASLPWIQDPGPVQPQDKSGLESSKKPLLAQSYGQIHEANWVNFVISPLCLTDSGNLKMIEQGDWCRSNLFGQMTKPCDGRSRCLQVIVVLGG